MKTQPNPNLKALSREYRARLECLWNKRLVNPRAFAPTADREHLTGIQIRKENVLFGKFSGDYVKYVLRRLTRDSDVQRRRLGHKQILAVGYGRGYDSKWLRQAIRAGLLTCWVDISSVAWIWAMADLQSQFSGIPPNIDKVGLEPTVRTLEIQSLLAEPEEAGIDIAGIEIWYLCRLLNCLSTRSAKLVLQEIGRTALGSESNSLKRNAVIVINALCDHNVSTPGGVSIVRSRRMILSNLRQGAGCPIACRFVRHYNYIGKLVTAMTIVAK